MRPLARSAAVSCLALAALAASGRPASATRLTRETPDADSLTSSFEVSGLQVILRRNTANDVVAANLYLLGGTHGLTDSTVGIEPMMLWVSELGTAHYSRTSLRRRMAEVGSTIVVEPQSDWTLYGFRGLRTTFDSTWMVWADRLMHPTLDSADVELVRSQLLSGVGQRRDSPDDYVEYLADSNAFAGTPYALSPAGTERSFSSITAAQLRRFRDTALVTSRMLLVVVGNVERAQVESLVQRTLGTLPAGHYQWTPPAPTATLPTPQPGPAATGPVADPGLPLEPAALEERQLPTNYILGYYAGPSAASPDYQALRVAAAVLGGRMFAEIRTRENLTYAVDAPFVERAIAAGGLYVTTVYPDSTLRVMRAEVRDLQAGLVDPDNLRVIVAQFITEYYLNNETNDRQANALAAAQLYRGDWHAADQFRTELEHVTPDDIRRVAQQYMRHIRFAYIGDTTRVSRTLLGLF